LWKKSRALLAYLVLQPGVPQSRQKLAEIFWPELAADAGRSNLRQALRNLQRALGEKPPTESGLLSDNHFICFHPGNNFTVDVLEFMASPLSCAPVRTPADCVSCLMRLEQTAGLYTGEFLTGLTLADCPEFEDWLQIQRESLHRRALVLLERLAQCHEHAGSFDRALSSALRYIEMEPWNEEGHRRIIRLLARSGQMAAALSQYKTCCRVLRDELGVVPDKRTRELAKSIQHGQFSEGSSLKDRRRTMRIPMSAGERRQVTVLCCSLTPTATVDPDESLELLRDPQACCLGIINDYSGHVVLTNDGGFLAYFGYPEASERAALMAVQAALAIACRHFDGLELRFGLHSGPVISSSVPDLPDTVGRTTSTAIRLRMLAGPGEILISSALHCLVTGYIEATRHGLVQQPGAAEGPEIFRLLGESGASYRLEARSGLTPLVGREAETTRLRDLWEKACLGQGQVLLLQGDPGIGKSRLAHHLRLQIQTEATVLELRCQSESSQTPFAPLKGFFEQLLKIRPADTAEARFAALVQYAETRHLEKTDELVPLLASMLSLPLFAPYGALILSPGEQRKRIMTFMINLLYDQATHKPVLLIVEDLHWIDPTSQELLMHLLHEKRTAPLLLLLTARPEFEPPWESTLVECLQIMPLNDRQVKQLVKLIGGHQAPWLLEQVASRADGVPLFAEELLLALREAAPHDPTAVPATLQDLLAARLDNLGDIRYTARLAATIGREFHLAVLAELSVLGDEPLMDALHQLQRAGLIEECAPGRFAFRHALFHDAAYHSQPRKEQRVTHRRIAEVLEESFSEIVRENPESLAQHWATADEHERSVRYRLEAARHANLHSAYHETLMHLRAGLESADRLPHGPLRMHLEFDLQIGQGWAFSALEGFASPAAAKAFGRAIALSEQHQESPDIFHALWGFWTSASSCWDNRYAEKLACKLLNMAKRSRDPVQNQQAHFALGNTLFWQGRFVEARKHLDRAVRLYEPGQHSTNIACFGENGGVTSRSYLSWTLWFLGYPDQALRISREALALAEEVGHPFTRAYALTFAMVLHRHLRLPNETLALADQVLALAHDHDFPLWQAGATLKRGWALAMLGQAEDLEGMRQSVEAMRAAMGGILAIFQETLADALCRLDCHAEAGPLIEEALANGSRIGDHHAEAELWRHRGSCLLQEGRQGEAEQALLQAITISRIQQARLPQLRATRDLARLRQSQGHVHEARRSLAEVYGVFSEGQDALDLQQAGQLLAELAGPNLESNVTSRATTE
jgi:DNA-binding SARP family transcriptional activator